MIFDPTLRPDHSGLPAAVRQTVLSAFLRHRDLGLNVQFIDPESGRLCENSFATEDRRDQFIRHLDRRRIDCITSDCQAYGRTEPLT
ncbi:hypothetical protein [Roseibium alexandrii]|uniref:hypothetical protein n=1 Tax=Roseibium alexandrii TaxID=388408 RepID=UPI003752CA54